MYRFFALSAVAAASLLIGCATSTENEVSNCPNNLNGYKVGDATPQYVEHCMGKAHRVDRNGPGGQYSYWYDLRGGAGAPGGGQSIGFVFTPDGKLVRAVAYGAR